MLKKIIKLFLSVFIIQLMTFNAVSFAEDSDDRDILTLGEAKSEYEAEQFIKTVEKSPIEQMFGHKLQQIGYDLFSASNSLSGNSRFTKEYSLNVGEKINVYLYGDSMDVISMSGSDVVQPIIATSVDSNGNIFVPGVGMVKAEGRTIGDVEKSIQSLARQKYNNINVRLTVSADTDFSIYVFGQVNHPGKVVISSNSSLIEALGAAGGVKKSGSLRNISYTSANGKKLHVDLYDLLFKNKKPTIQLHANDVIYVNNIGSVVAIGNGVNVPGIYEMLSSENVMDLISYAGGETPNTDLSVMTVSRFNPTTGDRYSEDVVRSQLKKLNLTNGDVFHLRSKYAKIEDTITLSGNVKRPLTMAYKEGMKLSDILNSKTELLDESFLHQAIITRVEGDSGEVITIPISLKDLFSGKEDIALQPKDNIGVLKNTHTSFIDVYGCVNTPKKYPYKSGMTLKNVMVDIKFEISSQSDSNSETQTGTIFDTDALNEKIAVSEVNNNNEEQKAVHIQYTPIDVSDVAVEITNAKGVLTTYYLYDIMVSSNQLATIILNEGDSVFFRPLRQNEVVKTINVAGLVNRPGVYKFVKGQKLSDILNAAGGLADNADLRGIVFSRKHIADQQIKIAQDNNEKDIRELESLMTGNATSNSAASSAGKESVKESLEAGEAALKRRYDARISLYITTRDINKIPEKSNIEILDGDSIFIPKYSNHISVIGEVYNETSFVYKKGMKSKAYIKAGGGFTSSAAKTKAYKIGVDGKAKKLGLLANKSVKPGDTIVVPRKFKGNDWLTPTLQTLQAISSIVSTAFIVTKI